MISAEGQAFKEKMIKKIEEHIQYHEDKIEEYKMELSIYKRD